MWKGLVTSNSNYNINIIDTPVSIRGEDEFIYFCVMVDQRGALSLISSWGNGQRFLPVQISDMPRAGL